MTLQKGSSAAPCLTPFYLSKPPASLPDWFCSAVQDDPIYHPMVIFTGLRHAPAREPNKIAPRA